MHSIPILRSEVLLRGSVPETSPLYGCYSTQYSIPNITNIGVRDYCSVLEHILYIWIQSLAFLFFFSFLKLY